MEDENFKISAVKKQISAAQKVTLIEFIEEHPELVKNKHSNQHTTANARSLWQEVSMKLNAIPGATKTWEEWRKTWRDLKNRTKQKKSKTKKEMNMTGGGPNTADVIDEMDDKILDLMGGDIVIDGLVNIPELGLLVDDNVPINIKDNTNKLVDHMYCVIHEENKNDNLENNSKGKEELPATPVTGKSNIRVRPPRNSIKNMPYPTSSNHSVKQTIANKAAIDLVKVTQETNNIKENYYTKKLQIMQDSLDVQKRNLKIQERIAIGIELLLKK